MFVNPGPPGELPVSFIEPWGILNNPTIHVGDVEASVRADCGVDEPGIEVGGAKELLPLGFGFAKHEFAIRIVHVGPTNHVKGGVAEKIGSPGIIGEFVPPINGLSA
tara:strand:+ start:290 stop:610 length:321 start_codon:yes stop_codon:yes gene_type:complete